jgi:DUF971 family protein
MSVIALIIDIDSYLSHSIIHSDFKRHGCSLSPNIYASCNCLTWPISLSAHPLTKIVLHKQSRRLEIHFDGANTFEYPCELLRVYSPSAEVRDHWKQKAKLVTDKQALNILELISIGQYAIKIVFDDGHNSWPVD